MKMTLEIPANLLREAESLAARQQQPVQDLIVEALRRALPANGSSPPDACSGKSRQKRPPLSPAAVKWLREWERWTEEVEGERRAGPSAREILRRSRR